jgi:hypothetical protein
MQNLSRAACALLVGTTLATTAQAQSAASNEAPTVRGPLTAMSAAEQTRLALTTAPEEVTSHAALYVLSKNGYVQTRAGTNGFSCLIERERLETIEPVCYDAEGTATTLKARIYREELRAQGLSEEAVRQKLDEGYKSGRLLAPRKAGMVYMLAHETLTWNAFTKSLAPSMPHYMLYAPYMKQEEMGGPVNRLIPYILWAGQPDALVIIVAPDSGASMKM